MTAAQHLSPNHIATIKQTIPLLESLGAEITAHFYRRMFRHNPEMQHIFNISHQRNGKQAFALFNAIASYAKHLDDLSSLSAMVERIANKHTSLHIQPKHYPIVGHHLLETLRELAPDAFTEKVESAWRAAYGFLAEIFIEKEEAIYQNNVENSGGWRGTRKFQLVEKTIESELVTSFVFQAADGKKIAHYLPGQYIGIQLKIPGREFQEIRQYSLSNAFDEECYRISVKRENKGVPGIVSNFLHDDLSLGDVLELYPPAGDFYYQDRHRPVILISAGVGITPMQAIVETLAVEKNRVPIFFLHACENSAQHSFRKRLWSLKKTLNLIDHTWYRTDLCEGENVHHGYMDLKQIQNDLPISDGDFYLCGPISFMQVIKQQLVCLGVSSTRIYYEVFGPHEAF